MRRSRAFTLIELLIVIGIIPALIAILLPALAKAREQAWCVTCQSNQRQILMAMQMYANENQGWLPVTQVGGFDGQPGSYFAILETDIAQYDWNNGTLWPYVSKDPLSRKRIFNCPADNVDPRPSDIGGATTMSKLVDPQHPRNFSYNFNPDLAAIQHLSHRYGIRYNQVLHPEHKIFVLEQENPRSPIGQINILAGGPKTGTGVRVGGGGVYPMLTIRHSGFCNAGMADGHVELMDGAIFTGTQFPDSLGGGTSITSDSYYHYITLTDPR